MSFTYSEKLAAKAFEVLGFKSLWSSSNEELVRQRNRWAARPMSRLGVTVDEETVAGHRVFVLTPDGGFDRTVFYSHGGGYVLDISTFHWRFLIDIARRSRTRMVVPIYPLAPEYSRAKVFPWLSSVLHRFAADGPVVLMGDSAGGGLSLALALDSKTTLQIDSVVLLSPWLDLSLTSPGIAEIDLIDPVLSVDGLRACGQSYLAGEQDDWRSSPLGQDYRGLPRMALFTGTRDILNIQAREFRNLCTEQQVSLDYHEYEGSLHVFPLFQTKPGMQARSEIIAFLLSD